MHPSIYQTAEDSYLMSRILKEKVPKLLKQNPKLKFLEIGVASGIHLEIAKKLRVKPERIFSTDINLKAVEHCKDLGFNCIYSNLFENVEGEFDLIIFNPPYLPQNSKEPLDSQLATTGGKTGSEIINEFLKQTKNYLTENGKIFLLTSSLTKNINWNNFNKKLLGEEKLFMEKLFVWELTKI